MSAPGDESPLWVLDLDGVIWTGSEPVPGSAEAVAELRDGGAKVVFATNNSFSTEQQQVDKLASFGIDAVGSVVSSAMAGASLISPGERVFVFGGPGVVEAVTQAGGELVDGFEQGGVGQGDRVPDAVLVGLDWDLSYDRLRSAVQAVRAGARFIATNTDSTYPTEKGLYPGAGALVAAVQRSTDVDPVVAGKPYQPMADLIRERFGREGIVVGDRADTDGAFARTLGFEFGLVFSGVLGPGDLPTDPMPDHTADDLLGLVRQSR